MDRNYKEELRKIMGQAIIGEETAILNVIELFMGRIIAKSFYNGQFREDIKLDIIEKLYTDIPKFKGIQKII